MKILVVNCGSSSLKYQLIEMENDEVLASGRCDRIGVKGIESPFVEYKGKDGKKLKHHLEIEFEQKKNYLYRNRLLFPALWNILWQNITAELSGIADRKTSGTDRKRSFYRKSLPSQRKALLVCAR